jgi:hypothetical protein
MRALLLMEDTELAASLEKFLSDYHSVNSVIHVTDVDSAKRQLTAEPTDWLVVEPDSVSSGSQAAIQDLISSDNSTVKTAFVISGDVRWSIFCQTHNNVEFLAKPFKISELNEKLVGQTIGQTSDAERRNQDRVDLKEIVFGQVLLESNKELDVVIHNISESGCLLHADAQKSGLAIYDTMTVFLPHAEPIVVKGEVVRAQAYEIEEIHSKNKYVLIGVRYTNVDGNTKTLLTDFVASMKQLA